MFLHPAVLQISLVIFIATLFRSAFGFGESLVAVPLLAIWLPLDIAVPLSVMVSIAIAGFVVVQNRKMIHQFYKWVYGALFGIGLFLFLIQ